jgi:SAM-dependent methyltransferase
VSGLGQAEEAEFVRYLEAKKPIDDRALNARVWEALSEALATRNSDEPLQVLELGCGIGTMLERVLERGLFGRAAQDGPAASGRMPGEVENTGAEGSHRTPTRIEYAGLDMSAGLIAAAHSRIPAWADRLGFTLEQAGQREELKCGDLLLHARWIVADAFDFAGDPARAGAFDLLLAHAFLDLVDARRAVQAFLPLLSEGGLFYFSMVFDGATIFEPALDPALDAQIERAYHQTMDRRVVAGRSSGHSRTGRLLLSLLPEAGGRILEAGSSDWVVIPRNRAYLPEESLLLDHVLSTIQRALTDHPELDRRDLQFWLDQRRRQLGRAELTYIAHQLDFLGEYVPPG